MVVIDAAVTVIKWAQSRKRRRGSVEDALDSVLHLTRVHERRAHSLNGALVEARYRRAVITSLKARDGRLERSRVSDARGKVDEHPARGRLIRLGESVDGFNDECRGDVRWK